MTTDARHIAIVPRAVGALGEWTVAGLGFKIYSIVADGRQVSEAMIEEARVFVSRDVPPIAALVGGSDGVGFVIIHPGETGLSVLAH
ncbi:MAG: hypothetical protein U1A06_09240 [Hoeflea sp.]|nr:hypothetical protein [Hoeflea sp.]